MMNHNCDPIFQDQEDDENQSSSGMFSSRHNQMTHSNNHSQHHKMTGMMMDKVTPSLEDSKSNPPQSAKDSKELCAEGSSFENSP